MTRRPVADDTSGPRRAGRPAIMARSPPDATVMVTLARLRWSARRRRARRSCRVKHLVAGAASRSWMRPVPAQACLRPMAAVRDSARRAPVSLRGLAGSWCAMGITTHAAAVEQRKSLRAFDIPCQVCCPKPLAVSGGQGNASARTCEGVWKPRVCRGRPLSSAAIASSRSWVTAASRRSWAGIGGAGRWCSRCCHAAKGCAGHRNRPPRRCRP
jgi:hypothetical protein